MTQYSCYIATEWYGNRKDQNQDTGPVEGHLPWTERAGADWQERKTREAK